MTEDDKVINLALEAGQILMANGAETYRVEETMTYILSTHFKDRIAVFALPTAVYVSVANSEDKMMTAFRTIRRHSTCLERISRVTNLSRELTAGKLTPDEMLVQLKETRKFSSYTKFQTIFANILITVAYTVAIGGSFMEGLFTIPAALIIGILQTREKEAVYIDFLNKVFYAFIIGFLTKSFAFFIPTLNVDMVVIGTIVILVPGVSFTHAIRDILSSDHLSASSRGLEAIITATAIALGIAISYSLFGLILKGAA